MGFAQKIFGLLNSLHCTMNPKINVRRKVIAHQNVKELFILDRKWKLGKRQYETFPREHSAQFSLQNNAKNSKMVINSKKISEFSRRICDAIRVLSLSYRDFSRTLISPKLHTSYVFSRCGRCGFSRKRAAR